MAEALNVAVNADSSARVMPPINSALDYFIVHVLSNISVVIALSILLVGIVAIILQFRLFRGGVVRPDEVLRISGVTLIITFSLALAAFLEGEDLKAAAPVFGLFSTIAGYLLGAARRGDGTPAPHEALRAPAEARDTAGADRAQPGTAGDMQ
jgi:hypothetical protein